MIDYILSQKANLMVIFSKEITSLPKVVHSRITVPQDLVKDFHEKLLENGIENVFQKIEKNSFPSVLKNMVHTDGSRGYNETILVWNPSQILFLESKTTHVDIKGTTEHRKSVFWELVPKILVEKKLYFKEIFGDNTEIQTILQDYCGFYGYLSYEASRQLENYVIRKDNEVIPTAIFTFPSNYLIEREKDFVYIDFYCETIEFPRLKIIEHSKETEFLTTNINFLDYINKIQSVKDYIVKGDIYQANFTQQFELSRSAEEGNSRNVFSELVYINPVQHSAYLEYPNFQILSISPELFLSIKRGMVISKPIKGTRPRGNSKEEDIKLKSDLLKSEKDLAELSMIVDLLRNDLSKSCLPGSVKVDKHASIESYSNVHHLVSTISGEITANPSESWRLFLRAFPGGSITGCPKIRAMEIIEELETVSRGIYTGSIGYISINGNLQFNIAIRTVTMTNRNMIFNAGGGIVYDSDPIDEYIESLHKASHLVSYFGYSFVGNILWLNGTFVNTNSADKQIRIVSEGFFETILVKDSIPQSLEWHWKRINKGLKYYNIQVLLPNEKEISLLIKLNLVINARLKLSVGVNKDSIETVMEIFPYKINNEPIQLILDNKAFAFSDIINHGVKPLKYFRYKEKTDFAMKKDFWDMVVIDNSGNILETGKSNIYLYLDSWITPPDNCVHGIVREQLLIKKIVNKKLIHFNELNRVKAIAVSNALIGIQPVTKIVTKSLDTIWSSDKAQNLKYIEELNLF